MIIYSGTTICILFINLRCRVIEWLGAKGKTQINTKPFARDIVETITKLAYQMPSYHGHGLKWTELDEDEDSSGEYIEYLVLLNHQVFKSVVGKQLT